MTASFAERVEQYIALRRGLGYRLARQTTYLRSFAAFLDRCGRDGPVPVALIVQWATDTRSHDPHNPARRLSAVSGVSALSRAAGRDGDPAGGAVGREPSPNATAHLLRSGNRKPARRRSCAVAPGGLRPDCYVTLFSLLASTGLRISEALALTRDDVDLAAAVMTIRTGRQARHGSWRCTPSTLEPLGTWAAHRDRVAGGPDSGAFFRTDRDEQLTCAAVRGTFKRLRRRLGWNSDGRTTPTHPRPAPPNGRRACPRLVCRRRRRRRQAARAGDLSRSRPDLGRVLVFQRHTRVDENRQRAVPHVRRAVLGRWR